MIESWYNRDYLEIIEDDRVNGTAPSVPDAYAINGHLGDTYGCPNGMYADHSKQLFYCSNDHEQFIQSFDFRLFFKNNMVKVIFCFFMN